MSIATLLEAAEYLERREREAEHGYATTVVPKYGFIQKRQKFKKSQGTRTTHNELEKNRRAHLRGSLETLKDLVPLVGESSKHTTLGLLNKAKGFIRSLEDKERKNHHLRDQLLREQRYLLRQIDQLNGHLPDSTTHRLRSISESSSGVSSASTSPTSEVDETDMTSYACNHSDTDDQSSVQSLTSDGGVTIIMKRLVVDQPTAFPFN